MLVTYHLADTSAVGAVQWGNLKAFYFQVVAELWLVTMDISGRHKQEDDSLHSHIKHNQPLQQYKLQTYNFDGQVL